MIRGIGTDIVEIARIERALARFGTRFETRLFTPGEIALAHARPNPARVFATRFAAKEAFVKALGTGLRGMRWQDIEVTKDALGKPALALHGAAAKALGTATVHLSLSDDGGIALAFVVLA